MAPTRTCVGCRQRRSNDLLVRLVVDAHGVLSVGGAQEGRGAWLCLDPGCWALAVRSKALPRALRRPVVAEGAALLEELHAMLDDSREE